MLFNCFINDLVLCLKKTKLYLFADDGKLVGEIETDSDTVEIQSDLDNLSEWSEVNDLPLSLPKCCCMHYGKNNPQCNYTLCAQVVPSVTEHEDLGILRTSDFVYSKHTSSWL